MLIIIFVINSSNELIFMNSVSIDTLPMNAPISSLWILVFLLKICDTDKSIIKSKPKLIINTKSRYIFNFNHLLNYKKKTHNNVSILRINLKFFLP